ncbi:MAG: hypothetical protein LBR18_05355 [Tannerella sp.]|jgi:hypothetical protein|nr:hypothetical protein [Tannerella sp.]
MRNIFVIMLFMATATVSANAQNEISLAGTWRVAPDVFGIGERNKWYASELPQQADLWMLEKLYYKGNISEQPEEMMLPGTDSDGRLGQAWTPSVGLTHGPVRIYAYDGIIWYEREITIPEAWKGKTVKLFLERVPGLSKAWLNGTFNGSIEAFATPHIHTLTADAKPGKHRLTMLISNNFERTGHYLLSGLSTKWNGVLGRIELQAENPVSISSIKIYPDIKHQKAKVDIALNNRDKAQAQGSLTLTVRKKGETKTVSVIKTDVLISDTLQITETEIAVPNAMLWDEFNPAIYEIETVLNIAGQSPESVTNTFGMREIHTLGKQFILNGEPLFLRGTHDACQFPFHAGPDMTREQWEKMLHTYKNYGLNHVRFHTCCPPEIAFQVADEIGIIFQVEMSSVEYFHEWKKILDTYGNHPSFCLFSCANELFTTDVTAPLIAKAKQYDPRHLYTCTSHPWQPNRSDDYYVTAWGVDNKQNVGIQWGGGDVVSVTRFNTDAPETASDYTDAVNGIEAPVVSHEMGQWAVYPDLAEIPKYTGTIRNYNFERIRDDLQSKGLLAQAPAFTQASGKLALILYKEEIEACLRTPNYGGFQLLDIHDYLGQQISTVGIINAFWESKGLTTAAGFREFCSPAVPLLRMNKRIWTQNETFEGNVEIAYFGKPLKNDVLPKWSIRDNAGKIVASGKLTKTRIKGRGLMPLGKISVSLNKLPAPAKLQIVVEAPEAEAINRWDIWLYPEDVSTKLPAEIKVFTEFNGDLVKTLEQGGNVLLFPQTKELPGSRPGCFTPVFWNSLFKWGNKAHTMGIFCDPKHPVFEAFPTDFFSDWQWHDLVMHSRAMVLDKVPSGMKPLVQVVDNFVTNQKLGLLFECKAGRGKLVVCSIDLFTDIPNRPVARQLLHSLLQYMQSNKFQPEYTINNNFYEN